MNGTSEKNCIETNGTEVVDVKIDKKVDFWE